MTKTEKREVLDALIIACALFRFDYEQLAILFDINDYVVTSKLADYKAIERAMRLMQREVDNDG